MYRARKFIKNFKLGTHKEVFYEYDLKKPLSKPIISIEPEVRLAEIESFSEIKKIWNVSQSQFTKRIQSGNSVCFLTYVGPNPIAYHWLQLEGQHFVQKGNFNFEVEKNVSAIIYHTRVKKEYQGQGLNTYIMWYMLDYCLKKGLQKVWIYTAADNIAQRKSLEKLGFEFIKSVSSLVVGRKYYSIKSL
ncbi:GNAT family N-acetyltransferase [Hyphobacterium sp. CCMP332]|nr:GNAT family N-acetyltransferase [Hyphobacterium sp. CCMP332]